ncbi:MAG: RES family NAD+ phosphorylase [Pseudomonadota bacterium]|nr:RES family NAD+ phosphorylase [Pseudomonadota bacterium]
MTARAVAVPWQASYRAIPSRFPPVSLFEDVADPDELDAVFALQALTNPRLRMAAGAIDLVPRSERVSGSGSTPVMAAFTHLNPQGSRFSDGTWGVYYAAESLETAIAEVGFHAARFMAETAQPPIDIDYRSYVAEIVQPLHDLRSRHWAAVHEPDSYGASVLLARVYRAAQSWGLLYRSVRRSGGECAAVLRPRAIRLPVVQGAHFSLRWDGHVISDWFLKSDHHSLVVR